MTVTIRPFRNGDAPGVIELILPIQRHEFAIPISAADQPDLADIEGFYQTGCGNFWLAEHLERIVGTVALKDIGNRQAALRKMFVAKEFRGGGQGVAAGLLKHLLVGARAVGVTDIFLGTTAAFQAAHRFYEKNSFVEIAKASLPPSFPLMAVDTKFYHLGLC